jgi:hypothetical protein
MSNFRPNPDEPRPAARLWTHEEDEYVKANYATVLARDIATHLGRSRQAVVQRATRHGLKGHRRAGWHSAQHDYFASIDTPEKAYILGLFMSDGCITRVNQLCLSLHVRDEAAVMHARDRIAPAARLNYHGTAGCPMVKFAIQSPRIAADLANLGLVPAKSYTVTWPARVPEEHAGSFVCGLFDGDGSLVHGATNMPRWTLISASPPLLEAVQQRAFNQTGTWIGGPYRDRRSKARSIVATGRGQVSDLDEWTHQHVAGLTRKRLPERTT